jgi:hypothetical protein
MTETDRKKFAAIMSAMGTVFSCDVPRALISLYFNALERLTIEQVSYAAQKAIACLRFFPKPVELLEYGRITPIQINGKIEPVLLPETITPPAEARQRLQNLFDELNRSFGTELKA